MHVLSVISVCKTIVESGNKLLSLLHKVPIQTSMDAEVLFLTKIISENRADILLCQNSAEISKKIKLYNSLNSFFNSPDSFVVSLASPTSESLWMP